MVAIPHTSELAELLAAHALGALDGPDLELLSAHLAEGCPECRRELERLGGDLEALAASLPPVAPADGARAALLRAIEGEVPAGGRREAGPAPAAFPQRHAPAVTPIERPERRGPAAPPIERRARGAWSWLPLAAALALAVISGVAFWNARRQVERLGEERVRLAADVARLETELTTSRSEGRRLVRALEVVAAPGMRPIALASLGGRPGSARTFVDPATRRAVFVASGLAQLPADRDYELWFIAGGKPVAAGVFDVDRSGNARLEVEQVAPPENVDAWAVTVEPAGGRPQPTGEMVLKS